MFPLMRFFVCVWAIVLSFMVSVPGAEREIASGFTSVKFLSFSEDGKTLYIVGNNGLQTGVAKCAVSENAPKVVMLPLTPFYQDITYFKNSIVEYSMNECVITSLAEGVPQEKILFSAANKLVGYKLCVIVPETMCGYYINNNTHNLAGYEIKTGKEIFTNPCNISIRVGVPSVSANQKWLAYSFGGEKDAFVVVSTADGKQKVCPDAPEKVDALAPSNDGKKLFFLPSPIARGKVKGVSLSVRDVKSNKDIAILKLPKEVFGHRLVLSGNERFVALSCDDSRDDHDGIFYIIDLKKKPKIITTTVFPQPAKNQLLSPKVIAFSPDEGYAAFERPNTGSVFLVKLSSSK